MLYLIRNHLDKMPLTKEYLEQICENKMDYQTRKIKWAANRLKKNNEAVKAWKIKQLAGLAGTHIVEVDEVINNIIKAGYRSIEGGN